MHCSLPLRSPAGVAVDQRDAERLKLLLQKVSSSLPASFPSELPSSPWLMSQWETELCVGPSLGYLSRRAGHPRGRDGGDTTRRELWSCPRPHTPLSLRSLLLPTVPAFSGWAVTLKKRLGSKGLLEAAVYGKLCLISFFFLFVLPWPGESEERVRSAC